MKSATSVKPVVRAKHELDATGKVLGRLSTQIATLLRGKNKVTFRPHEDAGDIVTVKHIENLHVTGNKMNQKIYYQFSGYPGGLKEALLKDVWAKNPAWVLRRAVERMLPKNRLRKAMLKRLIVEKKTDRS